VGLKLTVEPEIEPVTLEEAKKQVEIASSDNAHDVHLNRLIKSARRDVERYTRRALITQTWLFSGRSFDVRQVLLPRPPLLGVTSIYYTDASSVERLLSPSVYDVCTNDSPGFVEPKVSETWPSTDGSADAVLITYTAGFGSTVSDVPEEYRELILEIVRFRFFRDGSDDYPRHLTWSIECLKNGTSQGLFGLKQ
jgi:uncharacterized phiE125 gp8 family phage protein